MQAIDPQARDGRDAPEAPEADICLVLEGTYPFVTGGVSAWVHEIIRSQSERSFTLLCLYAGDMDLTPRYTLPPNVIGLKAVNVHALPKGAAFFPRADKLCHALEAPLTAMMTQTAGLEVFKSIEAALAPYHRHLGARTLLNSKAAFDLICRMYDRAHSDLSFIDYFWSWRTLIGGLYTGLLADLPPARVYHAVSTGYAGLIAVRGWLERGRPVLLSEHGLYTNERRVELAMASWLHDNTPPTLSLGERPQDLRDLWVNTFASYARACYEASAQIVTLHNVNRRLQIGDGAPPARITIVPNGIDVAGYAALRERDTLQTYRVALIGRVVPIKDIASFIQACHLMRDQLPGARFEIMGPTGEEPAYFERCKGLVSAFGLEDHVIFRGKVDVRREMDGIDLMVLSSISESQPLTILEAGAAGIPSVTTDVGGCREMVFGAADEQPPLGPGGDVVPVADPQALASAVTRLLTRPAEYTRCARAIRERVRRYYDLAEMHAAYRSIYDRLIEAETGQALPPPVSAEAEA